jgi:hypothetical protein
MLKITFIIQRGVGYWLPCLWWPLLTTLFMRNWSPTVTSADKKEPGDIGNVSAAGNWLQNYH